MYTYCISFRWQNQHVWFRAFNAEWFWEAYDMFQKDMEKCYVKEYAITSVYREDFIEYNPE